MLLLYCGDHAIFCVPTYTKDIDIIAIYVISA